MKGSTAFLQNKFRCPPMLELKEPKGPKGHPTVSTTNHFPSPKNQTKPASVSKGWPAPYRRFIGPWGQGSAKASLRESLVPGVTARPQASLWDHQPSEADQIEAGACANSSGGTFENECTARGNGSKQSSIWSASQGWWESLVPGVKTRPQASSRLIGGLVLEVAACGPGCDAGGEDHDEERDDRGDGDVEGRLAVVADHHACRSAARVKVVIAARVPP
eukprot:CAMPEP_0180286354 /NCGR_PEP_ID=MMETSP0988-20121125/12548_1 /TAXON_ID=697907 /ORGANISM="non described non described, Strain CCMP2293" /LENGTH=218 /DNA_ID=CAMNT_0022260115 /DNA_START=164 /DNA_END=819 /DNA_ORIENTATION=-